MLEFQRIIYSSGPEHASFNLTKNSGICTVNAGFEVFKKMLANSTAVLERSSYDSGMATAFLLLHRM